MLKIIIEFFYLFLDLFQKNRSDLVGTNPPLFFEHGLSKGTGVIKKTSAPLEQRLVELFSRNGYVWDSSVNIMGFRDESRMKEDIYNDILLIYVDGGIRYYLGSTDPGIYWTNLINRKNKGWNNGVAHLCLGQYLNTYVIGMHGNSSSSWRHEALCQWGNKVKIWRDVDANFINDDNYVEEGYFGINIHKGGGKKIDRYGAGCQIFKNPEEQIECMTLLKKSEKYKKNNRCRFNYTLFEKSQIGPLFNQLMKELQND